MTSYWSNKKVFLTGHTGFKGSWFLLLLRQLGANVFSYSLPPDKSSSLFEKLCASNDFLKSLDHTYGDIKDLDCLSKSVQSFDPDIVFHFAAQPLVIQSYADPLDTWNTNVIGTLNLLSSLQKIGHKCSIVIITTDKVYQNHQWSFGYREIDQLGGDDPYSASKAACELAVKSWYKSFCGSLHFQNPDISIATARAGNVIGGGDWASNRIVPDSVRALSSGEPIRIRNPLSTRPWQHVLEPLHGYLALAKHIHENDSPTYDSFNFGPLLSSNRTVKELTDTILSIWPGHSIIEPDSQQPPESKLLHLSIDKAVTTLNWRPLWDFNETVSRTVNWYKTYNDGRAAIDCCFEDLRYYNLCLDADSEFEQRF